MTLVSKSDIKNISRERNNIWQHTTSHLKKQILVQSKHFFLKKAVNYAKTISNVYPYKNGSVFIITNEKGCDYIAKNCPKGIKCQSLDEVL